jgi:isopenicillin-N N-acyltransferase like protein
MLNIFDLTAEPSHGRGEQLGRASIEQVGHSMDTYRALLPALTGRTWAELVDLAGPMIDAARHLDAAIVDDLVGLAAGAGVTFDDISVLCARSELLQLAGGSPMGECTTMTRAGRIGQTWDWFVRQLDASIVWRTPRFVAFAEAGMPPKIGVNSHGVAVTLNFLSTSLPVDLGGLPVHTLLHHMLEHARSTDEAVLNLLAAPAAACAAIGVLDTSGASAIVELAPHGRSAVAQTQHPLVQTNHCLFDNSVARLTRARQLSDEGATIEQVLSDNDGTWNPIALAHDPSASPFEQLGTVAAVIIDVHARTLHIAPGNPSHVGFTQQVSLTAGRT